MEISIESKEKSVGYWLNSGSPLVAEAIAMQGYDYLCIDEQHGFYDYSDIRNSIVAINAASGMLPSPPDVYVRVGANDPLLIGRVLDAGANGVVVPQISSARDAERLVNSVKYPPQGARSFGPMRARWRGHATPHEINSASFACAMIETREGLENIDSICAVDGLDGLYIGPSDFAISLGETPGVRDSDALEAAIRHVRARAADAELSVGIHTFSADEAYTRLRQGFTFVSIASDLTHIQGIARDHLVKVKELLK